MPPRSAKAKQSSRHQSKKQRRQFKAFFDKYHDFFEQFYDERRCRCPPVDLPDYYQTLNVPPNASTDEIKAAFRAIAKQHHPDKLPEDLRENKRQESVDYFLRAKEAYQVLTDPTKRRDYDEAFAAVEEEDDDDEDGEEVIRNLINQFRRNQRTQTPDSGRASSSSSSSANFNFQWTVRRRSQLRVFFHTYGYLVHLIVCICFSVFITWCLAYKLNLATFIVEPVFWLLARTLDVLYYVAYLALYLLTLYFGFALSLRVAQLSPSYYSFLGLHEFFKKTEDST